jgi:DedD protein
MAKSAENSGRDPTGDPALPQKKRARRRLVGAVALGLAAAVGLPMLLDSEPKREAPDLKVQIPSRDTPLKGVIPGPSSSRPNAPLGPGDVAPLPTPSNTTGEPTRAPSAAVDSTDASGRSSAGKPPSAKASPDTRDSSAKDKTSKDAATKDDTKAKAKEKADKLAADKAAAEQAAADRAAADKAAKATKAAKAAKDAKPTDKPTAQTAAGKKYLLQVGAFSSDKGAADQAERVKASGLRAFTEKIKTADGQRIRVRVGPFATRDEAEQARGQLKLSGIDAAVITP